MGEYMSTILNGLKTWVGGEIGKLRAKIEAVATAASKAASLAAKNKKDIATLNEDMDGAYQKANAAQTTANAAQTTANAAQTTANAAQTTARDRTWMALPELYLTKAHFEFDKQIEGRDHFIFNAFDYYKISDFAPHPAVVNVFNGSTESGGVSSAIYTGSNCCAYGLFIAVFWPGECKIPLKNVDITFTAPSRGLYARYKDGSNYMTAGGGSWEYYRNDLVIATKNYKRFRITVDDTGTLSATEVTS